MQRNSSPLICFSRKSEQVLTANLSSPVATESLGRAIGQNLLGGEVLLLIGDLGVGKTVLVRGLAQACGVLQETVNSPTFTLVQEYHGTHHLIHADLYRIENALDILNLGWAELFDGVRVVIVEWADRLPLAHFPTDHLMIQMSHRSRQSRSVTLTSTGPVSRELCHQILQNFPSTDRNAKQA